MQHLIDKQRSLTLYQSMLTELRTENKILKQTLKHLLSKKYHKAKTLGGGLEATADVQFNVPLFKQEFKLEEVKDADITDKTSELALILQTLDLKLNEAQESAKELPNLQELEQELQNQLQNLHLEFESQKEKAVRRHERTISTIESKTTTKVDVIVPNEMKVYQKHQKLKKELHSVTKFLNQIASECAEIEQLLVQPKLENMFVLGKKFELHDPKFKTGGCRFYP